MNGRQTPGFPNDSTLPLLVAFVLALAFLGIVVAIGLTDNGSTAPAAAATTTVAPATGDEAPAQIALTVGTAGDGRGTVRLVGDPKVCSTECTFKIDPDNSVTVIARADKGSTFVNWIGDCGGGRFCTLTSLNGQALNATALFALKTPPPDETPAVPECSDGIDNDGDGKIDGNDDDCLLGETESPADPSQTLPPPPPPPVVTTPIPPPIVLPPPPPPPPPPPFAPPPPPEPLPPPVDNSPSPPPVIPP